jgi:type I restriction-modification system DNA methylase subunit
MKFDVVLGNPPFSEKSKASDKLWAKFIAKSMKLLKQEGILAFITPSGWTSSTNMAYSLLKNKIVTANFSSAISKSFGGTGGTQRFAYFVASNKENKNVPACVFDEGVLIIDPTETPYAPQKSSSGHPYMIAKKMFLSSTPVHNWERIDYADSTKAVVVPMAKSANYLIKYEDDSFDGSRYKLKCDTVDGEAIASNLNLKLYRNLRWVLRSGPALAGNFKQLPIPASKMTDDEMYKHFNLSQEEIDYIEANVK